MEAPVSSTGDDDSNMKSEERHPASSVEGEDIVSGDGRETMSADIDLLHERVRGLECQKLAEDRLRERVKQLEEELALRRARTDLLIDLMASQDRLREMIDTLEEAISAHQSVHDVGRAAANNECAPVVPNDVAEINDVNMPQVPARVVSRASSAQSSGELPNKKQRHV